MLAEFFVEFEQLILLVSFIILKNLLMLLFGALLENLRLHIVIVNAHVLLQVFWVVGYDGLEFFGDAEDEVARDFG